MEEFIYEFKKVAKESGFKGRALVEEFKWETNGVISTNHKSTPGTRTLYNINNSLSLTITWLT